MVRELYFLQEFIALSDGRREIEQLTYVALVSTRKPGLAKKTSRSWIRQKSMVS